MATVAALLRPDYRLRNVAGVWMRHFTAFQGGWLIDATGIFLEPFFVLLAFAFGVGRFVNELSPGVTYPLFVAPGIIVGNAMWHALFECSWGAYHRMQTHRMYETILAAPVNMSELSAGEIIWGATRSVMTVSAVLAAAAALGLVGSPLAALIPAVGALTGLMFAGLGLVFASLAPNTHFLTLVFTMVGTPLFFFSGAFFPIDSLPGWLQPIAWAMPLTPAVHVARGLSTGRLAASHLYATLYMLGFAAAAYPVATRLLRRRLLV